MTRYDDEPRRGRDEDYPDDYGDEPRRESLMERRLRARRGEAVDDVLDEEEAPYTPRVQHRPAAFEPPVYVEGGGIGTTLLFLLLGGITVVLLFMLFGRQVVSSVTQSVPERVRTEVQRVVATPTPKVVDRGGTIRQIQALNRLETQQYSIERVVEASVERGNFLDNFLGERLLLIASGDVVVGVDLAKLKESDVDISADGESITLRLPPSEVFSARLNNDRTSVYDRQTGIGTQLTGGQDPTLETQARQEAERQIFDAACEDGAMQKAADEAQRSMEAFLRLLDFENVTVIGSAGVCAKPEST
jgi:hypothetical protein